MQPALKDADVMQADMRVLISCVLTLLLSSYVVVVSPDVFR